MGLMLRVAKPIGLLACVRSGDHVLHIPDVERRRRLARRHGLVAPVDSVPAVADALVGLHSSDPASVYLSVWARMDGIKVEDIESVLYDTAELVRMWAMRRTMFVVPPELGQIMYRAATCDVVTSEWRKLRKWVVANHDFRDPDAWLEQISGGAIDYLSSVGRSTTRDLKEKVDGLDTSLVVQQGTRAPVTMSMASRLLMLLAMDGRVAKGRPAGTWRSSQYEWLSLDEWSGDWFTDGAHDDPEAELVTRWLRSYGPGAFEDVRWWTGWTVAKTRRALSATGAIQVELEEGTGFVLEDDLDPSSDPGDWVALLPGLDPSVMGWKQRDWFLSDLAGRLFDRNGNAGPTVWANGEVVGGWAQRPDGTVAVGLLRDVPTATRRAIDREAQRLADWIGPVGLRFRFPSPYEKELRTS